MANFRLPADDLEYSVLAKLWELGCASVRELHDHLGEPEGLVYTTTAKVIDRLRAKNSFSAAGAARRLSIGHASSARSWKAHAPSLR